MKINDRNSTSSSATESGRASESQKTDRSQGARTGVTGADGYGDRVELSGTLGRLSQTLSSFQSDRASRTQALAARYQAGNFHPDAAATSRGIVSDALSGASH
jgi:hypothetical protein